MTRRRREWPASLRKPCEQAINAAIVILRVSFVQLSFLHLQDENELVACLVHSVELHDLLRVGAQHQHRDLVLNLLHPASGSSPTPQELRCILDAGLFVRCSTNRSEVSSGREMRENRLAMAKTSDPIHVCLQLTENNAENVPKSRKTTPSSPGNLNSWEFLRRRLHSAGNWVWKTCDLLADTFKRDPTYRNPNRRLTHSLVPVNLQTTRLVMSSNYDASVAINPSRGICKIKEQKWDNYLAKKKPETVRFS